MDVILKGYERPTLRLVFADPEMEGLEVRARRLSLGELHRMDTLSSASPTVEEATEKLAELYALLAGKLVGWNLVEDGIPVPLTADDLARQDLPFVRGITSALRRASTEVPAFLGSSSNGGETSLEASLPMDLPSESP